MYTDVYPKTKRTEEIVPHETADSKYRRLIADVIGLEEEYLDNFFVSAESSDGKFLMTQYNTPDNHDVSPSLAELRGMVMYNDGEKLVKVAPGSRYTKVVTLHTPHLPTQMNEEGKETVVITMKYKGDRSGEETREDVVFDLSPETKDKCRAYIKGTYLTHVKVNDEVYTFTAYSLDPSGKIKDATWDERWLIEYSHYLEDKGYSPEKIEEELQNAEKFPGDSETKYRLLRRPLRDRPQVKKASYAFSAPFTDTRDAMASPSNFFPKNTRTSPYSYSEILSIPENVSGSKAPVPTSGFVTLVRVDKNWEYGENDPWTPEEEGEEDYGIVDPSNELESLKKVYGNMKVVNGLLLSSKNSWATRHVTNLSINQANEILKYGYLPSFSSEEEKREYIQKMDEIIEATGDRSPFGEPIILTTLVDVVRHGKTVKVPCSVQIRPPAYQWRLSILDEYDSSPYHSYVYGTSLPVYNKNIPKNLELLSRKYPLYANKEGGVLGRKDIESYGQPKEGITFPMHDSAGNIIHTLEELIDNHREYVYPLSESNKKYRSIDDIVDKLATIKAFRESIMPTKLYSPYTNSLKPTIELSSQPLVCYLTILNPSRQALAIKAHERHLSEIRAVSDYMFYNSPEYNEAAYNLGAKPLTYAKTASITIWEQYKRDISRDPHLKGMPSFEPLPKVPNSNEGRRIIDQVNARNNARIDKFRNVGFAVLMRYNPKARLEIINTIISKLDASGKGVSGDMIRIMDSSYQGMGRKDRK